jgi:predicted dehydrogenase
MLTTVKIVLLGTGFGQAHAAVYAQRADMDEVVVFGRTLQKLAKIGGEYGYAISTDPDDSPPDRILAILAAESAPQKAASQGRTR